MSWDHHEQQYDQEVVQERLYSWLSLKCEDCVSSLGKYFCLNQFSLNWKLL